MSPSQRSPESSGTAHCCVAYELRITRRCLQDDLGYFGGAPFEDLAGEEIVKALIGRRSDGPTDTRQAIQMAGLAKEHFVMTLSALFQGRGWEEIETAEEMPNRSLAPGELAFRALSD